MNAFSRWVAFVLLLCGTATSTGCLGLGSFAMCLLSDDDCTTDFFAFGDLVVDDSSSPEQPSTVSGEVGFPCSSPEGCRVEEGIICDDVDPERGECRWADDQGVSTCEDAYRHLENDWSADVIVDGWFEPRTGTLPVDLRILGGVHVVGELTAEWGNLPGGELVLATNPGVAPYVVRADSVDDVYPDGVLRGQPVTTIEFSAPVGAISQEGGDFDALGVLLRYDGGPRSNRFCIGGPLIQVPDLIGGSD